MKGKQDELFTTTLKYINYSKKIYGNEFYDVNNKKELFLYLQEIISTAKNESKFYFLHFEVHGNKNGISLKNDEFVHWNELIPLFRELNILYKNTLSVYLAVCEGLSLLKAINKFDRSPFAFVIGGYSKVYDRDILNGFEEFYREFF